MEKKNFEILEHLCVLDVSEGGWKTELTKTKWYDGDILYDIRAWSPDYERFSGGFTMTEKQYQELGKYFNSKTEKE